MVLFERRTPLGRLYVCEGALGSVSLGILEDWTDRGPEPAARPLSVEVLVELVAVVAVIRCAADREEER